MILHDTSFEFFQWTTFHAFDSLVRSGCSCALITFCGEIITHKKIFLVPYSIQRFITLIPPFVLICSDYLFKLLLIGDSGVGKSCLLLRFAVSFQFFCIALFSLRFGLIWMSSCEYIFMLHLSPNCIYLDEIPTRYHLAYRVGGEFASALNIWVYNP